jgi:hypothetical protein
MRRRIKRVAKRGNIVAHAGRRIDLDHKDGLDLVLLIGLQPVAQLFGVDGAWPFAA